MQGVIGVEVAELATGTTTIKTGPGVFCGFAMKPDGANAVIVDVYDNTAGSGKRIGGGRVPSTSSGALPPSGVGASFAIGLTVVVAGTGAAVFVYYV